MTNTCLAKRGFFTLRGCSRPAAKLCEQCQKPTCQQHLSMRTGNKYCLDCAAKQSQQQQQQQGTGYYDDDWTYSYRNWYYMSHAYNPYGYGHRDYNSFSTTGDAVDNIDDNDAGDFSDS